MNFLRSLANFLGFDSNKDDDDFQQKQKKIVNDTSSQLQIKDFVAKENLCYCYYIEPSMPDQQILSLLKQPFEVIFASDVQRFCYYPGTKIICTFMGFTTQKKLMLGVRSPILENHDIHFFSSTNKKIKKTQSKEFSPKDNLVYYFFVEKPNFHYHLPNLNYVSDIQRSCLFPGTKKTYTFLGYNERIQSVYSYQIYQDIYKSNEYDDDILIYRPKQDSKSNKSNINLKTSKREANSTTHQSTNLSSTSSGNSYYKQQKNSVFDVFNPRKDLIYCFITEIQKPTKNLSNAKYTSLFGIRNATDIQRFRYLPDTDKIYTFFGFSDQEQLNQSINQSSIRAGSIDQKVYLYQKPSNETKETDKSSSASSSSNQFRPEKDLIYFYFKEKSNSNISFLNYYASDVQRNKFYPNTQESFSFFGFLTKEEGISAFNKSTLKLNEYDIKIFSTQNDKSFSSSTTAAANSTASKTTAMSSNNSKSKFSSFVPKQNLVYAFILERQKPLENLSNARYSSLFGVRNASDIQRFRYFPTTDKIYTFFGFSDQEQLNQSINQSSIRSGSVDQNVYLYQKPNNETKETIKSSSASSSSNQFRPEKDLIYFYFKEKNNSNISFLNYYASDVQRNKFYPNTQESFSFFGFLTKEEGISAFNKSTLILNEYDIKIFSTQNDKSFSSSSTTADSTDSTASKTTADSKTTTTVSSNNSKSKFSSFVPKQNLLYAFILERQKPQENLSNAKYSSLFGVRNASDIQRFRYFPTTDKIYTFFGFSDQQKLNKSINKSSVRSGAVNSEVYYYGNEADHKNQTSAQQIRSYSPPQQQNQSSQTQQTKSSSYQQTQLSSQQQKQTEFWTKQQTQYSPPQQQNQSLHNQQTKSSSYQQTQSSSQQQSQSSYHKQDSSRITVSLPSAKNDDEIKEPFFCPKDDLYYIYFKEKNCPFKNNIYSNVNYLDVNNIVDFQRGFRRNESDPEYYSFFGFLQSIERSLADKILQNQGKYIDTSSVKFFFDDDYYDYQSDEDDDDSEASKNSVQKEKSGSDKENGSRSSSNDDYRYNYKPPQTANESSNTAEKAAKSSNYSSSQTLDQQAKSGSSKKNTKFNYAPSIEQKNSMKSAQINSSNEAAKNKNRFNYTPQQNSNSNANLNAQTSSNNSNANLSAQTSSNNSNANLSAQTSSNNSASKQTDSRFNYSPQQSSNSNANLNAQTSSNTFSKNDYRFNYSPQQSIGSSSSTQTSSNNSDAKQTESRFNYSPQQSSNSNSNLSTQTSSSNSAAKQTDSRFNYSPQQSNTSNVNLNAQTSSNTASKNDYRFNYSPQQKNGSSTSTQINSSSNSDAKQTDSKSSTNAAAKKDSNETDNRFRYCPSQNESTEGSSTATKSEPNAAEQNNSVVSSSLPKFSSFPCISLAYKNFSPKPGLFYCFLAEINEPTYRSAFSQFTKLFGIKGSSDIQRFRFYPGTKCVYTFLGFADKEIMRREIIASSVKTNAINQAVFDFPYEFEAKNQQPIKSDSQSANSQSQQNQTSQKISSTNNSFQSPQNQAAADFSSKTNNSQFHYSIQSDSKNESKNGNENENDSSKESDIKVNENDSSKAVSSKIHLASEIKESDKNVNENDSIKAISSEIHLASEIKESDKKVIENADAENNDYDYDGFSDESNPEDKESDTSSDDDHDSLFSPDEDLYYVFFKEKKSDSKICRKSNTSLFGVNDIRDMQRFCKLGTGDSNSYTFFGFSRSIELNSAIITLKSQEEMIETESIQKFSLNDESGDDESENDGDYDDNDDEGEIYEDDFDEITLYTEDVLHHVQRVEKISPEEKIRIPT